MGKIEKLFEPGKIGPMELKNRIVMSPMVTNLANEFGGVTDRQIHYYLERARGGVGLIIAEAACVDAPRGKATVNELRIDNDKYISGLSELVETVKGEDIKIAAQLHHAGRANNLEITEGVESVAPSPIPCKIVKVQPRELRVEEIEKLIEAFGQAARRAKLAGFDAIELHGGHGYLIAGFLSPYTNKRVDQYGVDFEGRIKFPLQIIKRIREEVGENYPIIFRFSGDEFVEGGRKIEDSIRIAKCLEEASIDALDVSAGIPEARFWTLPPMSFPQGCLVHLSEKIKGAANVPTITVGKIKDPELAEQILLDGKADFVALGRELLAEPHWPRKVAAGRLDDINHCISCNHCLSERVLAGHRIRCKVNAMTGKEGEKIEISKEPKKVAVIGGGPAGMEAARVAALRKHKVTLYEKDRQLGGQLRLAVIPPFKKDIENILSYLSNQIKKAGVKIETGKEFTPNMVNKDQIDVLIIATGAKPYIPEIPGIERDHVFSAFEVLSGKFKNIGRKVVIIGGRLVGCEVADFLAEKDRDITILMRSSDWALDVEVITRADLIKRLEEKGIKKICNMVDIERITEKGVVFSKKKWNGRETIEADSVIIARGATPNSELFEALKNKVPEVYRIGDCKEPQSISEAIHEGFYVGNKI